MSKRIEALFTSPLATVRLLPVVRFFTVVTLFTVVILGISSCSNKDEAHETITIVDTAPAIDDTGPVAIKVILNTVNMRKSPGMNSKVVAKLQAGTQLEWLNQVSKVTAPIKLRGVRYNDPWLHVKTSDEIIGWVYAATVDVDSNSPSSRKLKQQLLTRRVQTFFGSGIAESINNYRQAYAQAATSDSFANMYTYGLGLRDKMVQVLSDKAQVDTKATADMSWLDNVLPGYSHEVVANGTRYYLFADFKTLEAKVSRTQGEEDDQFIEMYTTIFPEGHESFFPVWIKKTSASDSDSTGVSQLGKGIHHLVLEKIDSLSKTAPLFIPILTSIKQELVSDMTNPEASFSEDKSQRKAEIKQIIEAGYSMLNAEDLVALKKQ